MFAFIAYIQHFVWLAKCFWKSPYQMTVREVFSNKQDAWFLYECDTKTVYDQESKKLAIEVFGENDRGWRCQSHTREQIFENRFSRNPHQNLRTWYSLWLKLKEKSRLDQIFVVMLFVGVFFAGRCSV
jgi:hypothetical protein